MASVIDDEQCFVIVMIIDEVGDKTV